MPHIKSVRLVNVHFNNATQLYDDFIINMGGKNTTYDLENGGGKSLLLLMILQTVLPKSYLRKEKPVSLLFQGGHDRTSHVIVEWILEEGDGYRYALTGFCARKRRGAAETLLTGNAAEPENLQAADIEHLNWCVFCNDNKVTDIQAVPLVIEEGKAKKYAGFDDIRKYIQQMRQKELPAEVFDKIEQYQRYISAHNLIAAEWNIIRGINSGENSIESYFRQNASSRKLIENQFVKIIEDMEALNYGDKHSDESNLLADTLIEIRSRLKEYRKLKEHMGEYEKIKEYYDEFSRKNDALLYAFQEYEAYKRQSAAIRNLIDEQLRQLKQQETTALQELESNTAGGNEGKKLKRQLEAGLVNYEKSGMLATEARLQADCDYLTSERTEFKRKLNQLLTLEGYEAYRADKEQRDEIKEQLQIMEKDSDALQIEYQSAGGRLKFLSNRALTSLEKLLDRLEAEKNATVGEQKKAQQSLMTETEKIAVARAAIEQLQQQEKILSEAVGELNGFFLGRGETDAVYDAASFLQQLENALSKAEEETASAAAQIVSLDEKNLQIKIETANIKNSIARFAESKLESEEWLKKYEAQLASLEQKAAAFDKRTVNEYRKALVSILDKERLSKLEREIDTGRIRQKQQLSEARGYYVPNEEILTLADVLGSKCEFVQAGIDWVAKVGEAEKTQLLSMLPYLPFSVIVDRASFEKLKAGRLKTDFTSDYPVPIVNIETVRSLKTNKNDEVYYICSFAERMLNNSSYQQYVQRIETVLQTADDEIAAAAVRVKELSNALATVDAFQTRYPEAQVEDIRSKVALLNKKLNALQKQQRESNAVFDQNIAEKKQMQDRVVELSAAADECRERILKLTALIQAEKERTEKRAQLTAKQSEFAAVDKNMTTIKKTVEELDRQIRSLQEQIGRIEIERHDARKEKDGLTGFVEVETDSPMTQIRAAYNALHSAASGKITKKSSLQNQLEGCLKRLDMLRNRIKRDYDGELDEIERTENNGVRISIPSQKMIEQAKQDVKDNAARLKTIESKMTVVNRSIENADGRLEEILKDFSEEEKCSLPVYDNASRYQSEIELARQLIASYEQAVSMLADKLESIKDDSGRLRNQLEDYEAFLEREKVVNSGTQALEIREYRLFEKEYRQLEDVIRRQCVNWSDRLKAISVETVHFVIREPLEELKRIDQPANSEQCRGRQNSFAEYRENIEEQMRKISTDMIQLEIYQQDFARRCIQRAELVLGHLRKLESLSRIEVYGRRINMIELKLPEFDDQEKRLRMQVHIDGIVREIGEEETFDRKRIVASLSTKELLAQIVDMEKAVVRLYKIESIPENSKFYRWENAIGSEGQNNSLYFIFATCLISFIRMLSVTNSSIKTKKVIIADNPFGSTSAVYLWDPMFNILKQNDVQLIAPGHRIPREITSRFGVNYLLNQDILSDGRMRVVVKDVRVEEDEDRQKYIEPEQLSIF